MALLVLTSAIGGNALGDEPAGGSPAPRAAASEGPANGGTTALHFENDIVPVLTRFGCKSGGCHGRSGGQNGFKLSLYGFDPAADFAAISEDALGRRVSWTAPEESLLLRKASGEAPHGGGVRFDAKSPAYELLARWIAEGTPWGEDDAPMFAGITVEPAERVLPAAGGAGAGKEPAHKLRVVARYSDGSTRDVTGTAEFLNQSPAHLAVNADGEVRPLDAPGEGIVAVRYQGAVAISRWLRPHRAALPDDKYAAFQPATFVDQMVLARWKKLGIAPSPPASDAEFLRRVFLDALGTLPTPQEVREFLGDATPDKRARLIDRVLDRPEYAVYQAQRWGDVLRNRQGDAAQKDNSVKFTEWLRRSIADNVPFDRFARDLIAVEGKLEDHPQMDWYRQLNSPQNRVEDTTQVFLGMRVSCANCHNHPFERISQDDYWRFAAFFARVDAMPYGTVKTVKVKDEGTTAHPRTGQEMTPRPFGGQDVAYVKGEDPRLKLVDWMVAKENPYFARTLVNRVWAHYMKRGLVEPVDDHRATNPATDEAMLGALASVFVGKDSAVGIQDSGKGDTNGTPPVAAPVLNPYDVKALTKLILKSRVYGLSSQPLPENIGDRVSYARHHPQRLSAHVLLDAIDAATGHNTKFQNFADVPRAIQLPTELEPNDFLDVFGRTKRDTPCVCETRLEPNLSQVLFLLFSPELQQAVAHKEGTVAKLLAENRPTPELVDEIYLRTLSRLPNEAERRDATTFLDTTLPKQAAAEDLQWTLLNSKEFLFCH